MFNVKIIGSGKAVGSIVKKSSDLEKELSLELGWIEKATGIHSRFYVDSQNGESALSLGKDAAVKAIENSGLDYEDIDCIIGANGSPLQAIPCAASLYQRELKLEKSGIPCFDVDITCFSFPMAFFVASNLIHNGIYENVLIISADAPSKTLDNTTKEIRSLFGDGAAAFVIGPSNGESKVHNFLLRTYSMGADLTCVKGGGTLKHPNSPHTKLEDNVFQMNGPKVYKTAARYLRSFFKIFFENSHLQKSDFQYILPHQTSKNGIDILERHGFDRNQIGDHIRNHGNCIAASIPMLLHDYISTNQIDREDNVLIIGTSAGLSIGALSFTY
ncbi:MAG TPA: 3-oxoacyl-[acyl-carrier-protein] synthase III C-terminal domain-containing protein [Bacillota bacterium]